LNVTAEIVVLIGGGESRVRRKGYGRK